MISPSRVVGFPDLSAAHRAAMIAIVETHNNVRSTLWIKTD
jgi:hypothetical protein